jgi:hypothetical protein
VFGDVVRAERPDLQEEYFRVVRAGWLRMGVGSAATMKVLIRVEGRSPDSADDGLLEAKALRERGRLPCIEEPPKRPTVRVVLGSQQVGRLKHDILVAGPELPIPGVTMQGQQLSNWWIRSWDPSYREIGVDDLGSVEDLSAIVYDSGLQLGASSLSGRSPADPRVRDRSLASIAVLETRLRRSARLLVEELLRGWRDLTAPQRYIGRRDQSADHPRAMR